MSIRRGILLIMQSINGNLAGQLEIVALEMRDALDKLGEVVGTVTA